MIKKNNNYKNWHHQTWHKNSMKRNAQWGNWKKKNQINQKNDWKRKQLKEYDQIKKKN